MEREGDKDREREKRGREREPAIIQRVILTD